MPLEKYYAGDEAFAGLARAYADEWEKCNFKEELTAACNGDVAIAIVVFGHLSAHALTWLEDKVPALDGLTPKECMKTENGLKRLKECLLRMPC
jgi:hypothetical protein